MRSDESFAAPSGFLEEKSFEKLITAFIIYIFIVWVRILYMPYTIRNITEQPF